MNENPYRSPQLDIEQVSAETIGAGESWKIARFGIWAGGFIGITVGSIGGASLTVLMILIESDQASWLQHLDGVESAITAVFASAIVAFVFAGLTGMICGPIMGVLVAALDRRIRSLFPVFAAIICGLVFAAAGLLIPPVPSIINFVACGVMGATGGGWSARAMANFVTSLRSCADDDDSNDAGDPSHATVSATPGLNQQT